MNDWLANAELGGNVSFIKDNPHVYRNPDIAAYLNSDGVTDEQDYEPVPLKWLVFFYIGTEEYQSTVVAESHDAALEIWCAQNRDGEDPTAVLLDGELGQY